VEKTIQEALTETEARAEAAETRLKDIDQREIIERLATENAADALAKAKAETEELAKAAAERSQQIVDAVRAGLTRELGKYQITPAITFPDALRHGNLSKADRHLLDIAMGRKAMAGATSTSGQEWHPDEVLRTELSELAESQNLVRQFMTTITMTDDVVKVPILSARGTVYYKAENSAPTTTAPTTGEVTLTARKLIGLYEWSYELEEDAVINLLPIMKKSLAKAIANGEEAALVWGDDTTTAASNIDCNVTTGNPQLAFNGLWYTAKTGSTWYNAYATSWATSIRAMRQEMDVYAEDFESLVLIMPLYVYGALVSDSGFTTMDKMGSYASQLTGRLPKAAAGIYKFGFFDGIPVICSSYVYKTDANGVRLTTTASNSKYGFILANRDYCFLGDRRKMTLEMDQDITAQTRKLVCSVRIGFGIAFGSSGSVGACYNG
jgi:HK97 family phage major capsid protein